MIGENRESSGAARTSVLAEITQLERLPLRASLETSRCFCSPETPHITGLLGQSVSLSDWNLMGYWKLQR